MKRIKKAILYMAAMTATVLIIAGGAKSVDYARTAAGICMDVIVPSLFPFFICSGLLIYSGFCNSIAMVFRPVMKPLFNVGGAGAAAFVLGILSGYPLGAHTACRLYESNYLSKTETERLLAFCNNSGPLFILGAVGVSLYSSPQIGAVLYGAHILASITVGILFRFYKYKEYKAYEADITTSEIDPGSLFSTVIKNSISSILTICGTVIFFSTITVLAVDFIPANDAVKGVITGMCEFVTGTVKVSQIQMELWKKLILSAFIVGFAGVSVHMQVIGVTAGYGLSLKPYICGKFIHGLLSALYVWIFLQFIRPAQMVFAYGSLDINGGYAMSAAIISVMVISTVCAGGIATLLGILNGTLKKSGRKSSAHKISS